MSDKQLPLGPDYIARAAAISKRASKQRRRTKLPVIQPQLIADRTFTPQPGTPATRAQCPVERPCPFVRCRYHLFAEDAEHRAGRPGLSSVKRDSRGLTLSQPGNAGTERPGTTLRPAWLEVRGLEVEREVRVFVWRNDDGLTLLETRDGALDYWLARLHPGEPVLAFDDDTGELAAKVALTSDGLRFDRAFDATFLVLTRVREVSSCALDLIDRHGKLTNEQCGDALGRHRTLIAREMKRATRKAIEVARGMGMEPEEFLRGLRELGAGQ